MRCYSGFPLLACCCAVLVGCSAQPVFVPLPPTHPASPWACESPVSAPSGTLAIKREDIVPPHPDWQIPGMRDNELHGHAAGAPTPMDMMGHGHMMMDGGHGSMSGGHGATHSGHAPGMVKMSAPPDQVDYVPEGAHDPSGHAEPDEHEPEMHLDHTDPARRKAGFKAAPIAPPMEHGAHAGHEMDTPEEEPAPDEPAPDEPAVDHEAMGHTPAERVETPAETPAPSPAPAMDHSQHAH